MASIEKAKTALLVMDFQNDLVDPTGKFAASGGPAQVQEKKVLENTAKAIASARSKGVPVIHVAVVYRKGYPEANVSAPLFAGVKESGALMEGTWGAEFHPTVKPQDGEVVVVKRGVSAFAGTDLDIVLKAKGIHQLVLTGFATNFVVEGTARDAVDRGYAAIVLKDCCASFSGEMHRFALEAVLPQLAVVSTMDDFVQTL